MGSYKMMILSAFKVMVVSQVGGTCYGNKTGFFFCFFCQQMTDLHESVFNINIKKKVKAVLVWSDKLDHSANKNYFSSVY